jgi:hypothetical protein
LENKIFVKKTTTKLPQKLAPVVKDLHLNMLTKPMSPGKTKSASKYVDEADERG